MTNKNCRECLLVKVDVESGGDVDGCLRDDIIDEFEERYRRDFGRLRCQENDVGFMPFTQDFQPRIDPTEFKIWAESFNRARDIAYDETRRRLIERVKRDLGIRVGKRRFLAICLVCPWKGERPSMSVVHAEHYGLKHVREEHPEAEGFVAAVQEIHADPGDRTKV